MATLSSIITPTNVLTDTSTSTLTNKTWNGNTIGVAYGGTGLTALGTANQVLKVNSGATALEYGSVASASIQEFTSSGTWTKPSGANFVMVEALGGGGGGGSGQITSAGSDQWGGCGGGGGAYAYRVFKASELPSSVVVTVGAGGTGGAAKTGTSENGAAGTNGGNSSFGNLLVAYRGAGGPGGSISQDGGIGGGVLGTSGEPGIALGTNVTSGRYHGAFGAGFGDVSTSAARTYASGFGGGGGGGAGARNGNINTAGAGGGSYQGGAGGGAGGQRSSGAVDYISGEGGTYFNGDSGGVPVGRYGVAANGFLPRLGGGGGRLKETVASTSFNAIAYGDSKFVATNSDSLICVSSDNGATWTLQASSPIVTNSRIFYLNGQWCFVTSTRLAVSSNLTSYTVRTITNGTSLGYYSGTYVLVGTSGTIQTSTDLISWTVRTSGTTQNLNHVIHDGTRWVVVGNNGVSLTSTDAITWTLVTTASSGNWSRVASSGTALVATSSANPYAWRSTDAGATWAAVSTTLTQGSNGRVIYAGSQFVFCSDTDVWTAAAAGSTWTQRTDGLTDSYGGIAYSGSAYAICSNTTNSTVGITSPTAATWTQRTFSSTNFNNTAGGNGGIAAGGGGGSAAQNGDTGGSGAGGNGGNGLVRVYTW